MDGNRAGHRTGVLASAFSHQAATISASSARLERLYEILNRPTDLSFTQWLHWYAVALEFSPDLILELGRGYGNSTCVLTEAAGRLPGTKVVSLCLTNAWEEETVGRIAGYVPEDWFRPLDARVGDMLQIDPQELIGDAQRVLVVWDAHGWDIAEWMLSRVMPQLARVEHLVIMHDVSDNRFLSRDYLNYADLPLWRNMEAAHAGDSARLCLGWINTAVDQFIPVVDFLTRNQSELQSADHDLQSFLRLNPELAQELSAQMGDAPVGSLAHWAYFSLNGVSNPVFPAPAKHRTQPAPDAPPRSDQTGPDTTSAAKVNEADPDYIRGLKRDLERNLWYGRPGPVTVARILAKSLLGFYR